MQDRAWRIIYLVSAVAAAVIAAAVLDAPASPTEPAGRWLEPLVLIAVSAFLFEPFFSGNGPAVANSLVALALGVNPRSCRVLASYVPRDRSGIKHKRVD